MNNNINEKIKTNKKQKQNKIGQRTEHIKEKNDALKKC